MPSDCLDFSETSFLSPLLRDYLSQRKELRGFYNRYPALHSFKDQMLEKQKNYPAQHRKILVDDLREQYSGLELGEAVEEHLHLLEQNESYTITTGHQLNLGTGPLYFLYKISSAIHLCRQLKESHPDKNFIPVYWMATEDHDFDEINFLHLHNKKIQWTRPDGGAVGRMDLGGIEDILTEMEKQLGPGQYAQKLMAIFKDAYLGEQNLAAAMRRLVHSLFGEYGLVILDADRPVLKSLFRPYAVREIEEKICYTEVSSANTALKNIDAKYKIQVNPRECNLFYLTTDKRSRLIKLEEGFGLQDSDKRFTNQELMQELEEHPERFSPNVLLRPVYQEVLLPNLCYIGGGGELAYWLQLQGSFMQFGVTFPILLLRNSALLWTQKQRRKWQSFGFGLTDLFTSRQQLIDQQVERISEIPMDFSPQREYLVQQFQQLYRLAEQTDVSFKGAVAAQEKKQLKGLDKLEKRLRKAQRRKLDQEVQRLSSLHEALFPQEKLQERFANFSEFYCLSEGKLIETLVEELDPLRKGFLFLTVDS